MATTARARCAFMLGHPVGHTALPGAVARWVIQTGADAMLVPVSMAPDGLAAALDMVRKADTCDGLVLTAPFKQEAGRFMDEVTPRAEVAGAVNLVRRTENGTLVGDNTDGLGMRLALEAAEATLSGARVLIFGCGGAGSAIAQSLSSAAPEAQIDVTDPVAARVARLTRKVAVRGSASPASLAPYDIVINATMLGLGGIGQVHDLSGLRAGAHVADVIPGDTPLLKAAAAKGAHCVPGERMAQEQMPAILQTLGWLHDP